MHRSRLYLASSQIHLTSDKSLHLHENSTTSLYPRKTQKNKPRAASTSSARLAYCEVKLLNQDKLPSCRTEIHRCKKFTLNRFYLDGFKNRTNNRKTESLVQPQGTRVLFGNLQRHNLNATGLKTSKRITDNC